jgi:hypothetical protein
MVGSGLASLAVLMSIVGFSTSGSAPAGRPTVSLAADRAGIAYWSSQVQLDSQLIVSRDQQEEADGLRLPPCAQTPAVNPPCRGFDSITALAMSPQIFADVQAVDDAQTQLTDAQVWLHAFQMKLHRDVTIR